MPNNASVHELTTDDISQNDDIIGSNSYEHISSSSGNDTFEGYPSNDNTGHYGEANQYTITRSGTSIVVADDMASRDGTNTLTNVGHVQFTDPSIDLTTTDDTARVSTSHLDSLTDITHINRAPESSELSFWTDRLATGETVNQIPQESYTAGVQFGSINNYTANMSNSDFIGTGDANIFDRAGSTESITSEIGYWNNQITSGLVTRTGVLDHMVSAAHSLANDPTWGWEDTLMNNRIAVGNENMHAVHHGVDYNAPTDVLAHAITPTDMEPINLVGTANDVNLDWWA